MKNFKLPDTLVLIFTFVIMAAVLTWILPGGNYDRIEKGGRSLLVPESYQTVENVPQGLSDVLKAPIRGFVDAAEIIAFIFFVGGAFVLIQKTGALDALILRIVSAHKKSKFIRITLIPLTMVVFSTFGAVFGMSEEIIPFILIFVPLAISLGYDSIMGVSIPFVGAGAGFAGAYLNPFTVGIAQGIAELPPFSGWEYRLVVWLAATLAAIFFVLWYGRKIKKNPQASPVYKIDEYWRKRAIGSDDQNADATLSSRHLLILIIFLAAIVLLILGVSLAGWFIIEIAALFLGTAVLIGLVSSLTVNEIAEALLAGAKEMMRVAFIIALARAILVICLDGKILDTILREVSGWIGGTRPVIAAQMMFIVQSVINVFIPSGSGQAALVMPIMSPLSDLLHVTRQTAVLAFQMGDGFTNLIIPTSGVTMGVLGIARIPYEKWFSWMWPLQIIFFVLALLLLIPPVLINWGPF